MPYKLANGLTTPGDFDKNNPCCEEKHELTLWPNYLTPLTLLCGALASGATHPGLRGEVAALRR
jgi:hypothetical protein